MKYINGMKADRLTEIWNANVDGTVYDLANIVADKLMESNPQLVLQTNGYLHIAVIEVAQELVSTYGLIWGKLWRDAGFGTLEKYDHRWLIIFDKEDEALLTQSVIDKYNKGVA